MDVVRYIHAADLHLDTPFLGLARETAQGEHLARLLREATFTALERLFRLCETEKPHFLVLAGDIYNEENHSVKAQLALRDGCRRLEAVGVRVFLAHGNHDPLNSQLTTLTWPDNVTVFGPEVESRTVGQDGRPLAVVHGISHARLRENRNLARLFRRDAEKDCFQLGVLHCTLEGQAKADRYAPCSLEDLKAAGLDAWALGHVHEGQILSQTPFVAYSGSAQGLHINEPGPRGCLRVSARPTPEGGYVCQAEPVRLGPVQWALVEADLDGVEQLDVVETRLAAALEAAAEATPPGCEALIARLRLCGRTGLDTLLRDPTHQTDLIERLEALQTATPGVWIKDMQASTSPLLDMEAALAREDLLGEVLRLAQNLEDQPEALAALADTALAPLYGHGQLRKLLSPVDAANRRALLDEARRLCTDLLEAR